VRWRSYGISRGRVEALGDDSFARHMRAMSEDQDKPKPVTPPAPPAPPAAKEVGGPKGPEPTRYGDWEQKGRCTDF
jgi:hypothetical protein